MSARLAALCVCLVLPLSAQLTRVVSTVQPGGVLFQGRILVSAQAMEYNGVPYDPMSQVPYTITNGALDVSLPPNLGSLPGGTYYTVQFIPRTGGGLGWTERWQLPATASVLSRATVVIATFTSPGAISRLSPTQFAQAGATPLQAIRWNGSYYQPMDDPAGSGVTTTGGDGISCAGSICSIDDTVVFQYGLGSGAPVITAPAGSLMYLNTVTHRPYFPIQDNVFERLALYSELAGATPASASVLGSVKCGTNTTCAADGTLNVAAGGDVVGPASSTSGALAKFSNTAGKQLESGPIIVTSVGTPGSDTSIPTEKAVRDAITAGGGGGGSTPATVLYDPSARRTAYVVYPGSGTLFSGFGDVAGATGTVTAGTITDTAPVHGNILSTTAVDSLAQVSGVVMWRTGRNLHLKAMLRLVDTAQVRAYVGWTSGNMANATTSPMSSGHWMGFRYDPALDTNWRCVQDAGTGTLTTADSGVAVDSSWKAMEVRQDDATSTVRYYIAGTQVCAMSTNYPGIGTNQNMRWGVVSRTTEAVAKNIQLAYVFATADVLN